MAESIYFVTGVDASKGDVPLRIYWNLTPGFSADFWIAVETNDPGEFDAIVKAQNYAVPTMKVSRTLTRDDAFPDGNRYFFEVSLSGVIQPPQFQIVASHTSPGGEKILTKQTSSLNKDPMGLTLQTHPQ